MIVQASLLKELMPQMKSSAGDQKKMKEDGNKLHELQDEIKKDFKDRVSILAVAYHNLGVEQEFLK